MRSSNYSEVAESFKGDSGKCYLRELLFGAKASVG